MCNLLFYKSLVVLQEPYSNIRDIFNYYLLGINALSILSNITS